MAKNSILEKILDSVFYSNSMKKASRMSTNTVGILQLLKNVLSKIQKDGRGTVLESIFGKVVSLGKLLKYYATGQYRDIELKNIVIIITAFVYFLSPIDLVPDFIPMLGFADDIALITFVFNSVATELEKFEVWLLNQNLN